LSADELARAALDAETVTVDTEQLQASGRISWRVSDEPITMANGEILTEADFSAWPNEVEHAIDVERLLDRARRAWEEPRSHG
jgi:hypothetical protein